MKEIRYITHRISQSAFLLGIAAVVFPLYVIFTAVTQGDQSLQWSSIVMALFMATAKVMIASVCAFAATYLQLNFRMLILMLVFAIFMFPAELIFSSTHNTAGEFNKLNSYAAFTLPIVAAATAVFLFRQFFIHVPIELVEAAKMDGIKPVQFFKDIYLPLSKTSIVALFIIQCAALVQVFAIWPH